MSSVRKDVGAATHQGFRSSASRTTTSSASGFHSADKYVEEECTTNSLVIVHQKEGEWTPVAKDWLATFVPTESSLNSNFRPFGNPSDLPDIRPMSSQDEELVSQHQLEKHKELEARLGSQIDGYATIVETSGPGILVRELPDVVGTKVWFGEWLLWQILSKEDLSNVNSVLELGAGCGLAGLLLASKGFNVTLSDTNSGYVGAEKTFENLEFNLDLNRKFIELKGGQVQALALDWKDRSNCTKADLVIGADIIYEPRLFEDLISTILTASSKAIIVQNVRREGTEKFKEACEARGVRVTTTSISKEYIEDTPIPETDLLLYEAWTLEEIPKP
mmetsp:Transcript_34836/g.54459  ORF Transcript_34836/g.54459 Transcript_34836/m.54459 type:complete len:333 (-) Transcript_34836:208-1206(-)